VLGCRGCVRRLSRSASRALSERLPESVAAAVWEFIRGPLADNPYRVGKKLRGSYTGLFTARRGSYRVIYEIRDAEVLITVVTIDHRRDVYHS
jgi:mRNA-degrading endonuclease RelE of RelBE toxin-antitoxin system